MRACLQRNRVIRCRLGHWAAAKPVIHSREGPALLCHLRSPFSMFLDSISASILRESGCMGRPFTSRTTSGSQPGQARWQPQSQRTPKASAPKADGSTESSPIANSSPRLRFPRPNGNRCGRRQSCYANTMVRVRPIPIRNSLEKQPLPPDSGQESGRA